MDKHSPVNVAGMTASAHILVVDDDRDIRQLVCDYLLKYEYRVSAAANGAEMWKALAAHAIDLVVLDVMMPGQDGLSLCRELRARDEPQIPIIMLTALRDEMDRIVGLEMGADDYLAKPFAPRELLARIKAVLRRTAMLPRNLQTDNAPPFIGFDDWRLDTRGRHLLDAEGTMVDLTGGEYRMLRVLLAHPHKVVSRDQLLSLTQGREADPFDRSIDLLVSRLRKRLRDDVKEPRYIKTVRNEGYVFCATVSSSAT
jgi:two-component system OmpR family response regulator